MCSDSITVPFAGWAGADVSMSPEARENLRAKADAFRASRINTRCALG